MLSNFDVAKANEILGVVYGQVQHRALPAFGCDMLLDHDNCDAERTVGATISHRFLSKFQRPDVSRRSLLTQECFDNWISFDEALGSYDFYAQSPESRGLLYRARKKLSDWLSKYKYQPVFDASFTPGETFNSSNGYVSVYQKLRRKENWTVTHDAADDFIRLCYNNLSLRRCAKKHMARLTGEQYKQLFRQHSAARNPGYAVFSARMYEEVITLVYGSRGSSVDKNNEKRRFINVEPFGNVILQRSVALGLRDVLRSLGNDLEIGQDIHRIRIADPNVATIDFSNASDSVILAVCKLLLPGCLYRYLELYRSPMVLINDDYYIANKLSSMGNGFTFEVMTLLLLAIARTLDDEATVYGDDVIISNASAAEFIKGAQAIGFVVNQKKTFIDSPFRESCGAFYMDGYGYITCFDIHWCESEQDVIINANKFFLMSQRESCLKDLCVEAYEALLSCVPPCCLGPVDETANPTLESRFVYCRSYRKRHMRATPNVKVWQDVTSKTGHIVTELCRSLNDAVLVSVPKLQLKEGSRATRVLPDSTFKYSSYLYSGVVARDTIRNTGVLVYNLNYLFSDGTLIPVSWFNQRLSENNVIYIASVWAMWFPEDFFRAYKLREVMARWGT